MQIYEEWKALPAEEKVKYEDCFSYSAFSFTGSAFHFFLKIEAICKTDGLGILSFSACKVDQINYCQAMCTMPSCHTLTVKILPSMKGWSA